MRTSSPTMDMSITVKQGFQWSGTWRSLALAGSLSMVVQGSSSCAANAEPAFVAKLRPLVQSAMKDWVTPGIMVLVDVPGQSTWIEGFGTSDLATKAPISADDHHRVGSVTKTQTGEAVLLLVDEGKIGLDDPVENTCRVWCRTALTSPFGKCST